MTDEERAAYDALVEAARVIDATWQSWNWRKIPWGKFGIRYSQNDLLRALPALRAALANVPREAAK